MAYIERVLVTGARGRIGRDLLPRLEQSRFQVFGLDREACDQANFIRCDLNDPQAMREALRGMHAVVHLAGQSWEGDFHRELLADNLAGCYNMFEAASRAGVRRVVFASTSHVLGDALNGHSSPNESQAPRPDTLYAVTKLFGENLGRYYADHRGISVICVRIGWYLRDDDERLFLNPTAQALWVSGRDIEQFIVRSLSQLGVHFEILNCTSANSPPRVSLERAREVIGYRPRDGIKRRAQVTGAETHLDPLIVIGSIRAGTTLLAQCLASHPKIRYLNFEAIREWQELAGIEISTSSDENQGCPPYPEDHLDSGQLDKARRGFGDLAARAGIPPGMQWVIKNPHLWNKLSLVRAIFPNATIIVASRNIRSTVASLKQLWLSAHQRQDTRYYLPVDSRQCWWISKGGLDSVDRHRVYPYGGIELLADYWLRVYEEIGRVARDSDNYVRVLNRDLVNNSQTALHPVLDAMGLDGLDFRHDLENREDLAKTRLTEEEQNVLDRFIRRNRERIEGLEWADTMP